MKSKFICGEMGGFSVAIVFPEFFVHRDMAQITGMEVVSAGFVSVGTTEDGDVAVEPYGRSGSIGVGVTEENMKLTKSCLETALGLR